MAYYSLSVVSPTVGGRIIGVHHGRDIISMPTTPFVRAGAGGQSVAISSQHTRSYIIEKIYISHHYHLLRERTGSRLPV